MRKVVAHVFYSLQSAGKWSFSNPKTTYSVFYVLNKPRQLVMDTKMVFAHTNSSVAQMSQQRKNKQTNNQHSTTGLAIISE